MKTYFILIFAFIFNLNASGQNNPPEFTSEPVTEVYDVELYKYLITASDLDGDSIAFIDIIIPEWLSFFNIERDTAYLIGTASQFFDSAYVNIGITDGTDTAYQAFNIYLYCPNCGISIFSEPVDTGIVNEDYEYNIYATNCDPMYYAIFECENLPSWLNLENVGYNMAVLSGIPGIDDIGTYEIIIRAYVPNSPCNNENFQLFDLKVLEKITSIYKSSINNFIIYPIPCKDRLSIIPGNEAYNNYNIKIYDALGRILLSVNNLRQCYKLDMSFLAKGMYVLEISDENNNVFFLDKLIKR